MLDAMYARVECRGCLLERVEDGIMVGSLCRKEVGWVKYTDRYVKCIDILYVDTGYAGEECRG